MSPRKPPLNESAAIYASQGVPTCLPPATTAAPIGSRRCTPRRPPLNLAYGVLKLAERIVPGVKLLREAHAKTPILPV
jgi:hypothetical protein